jgi:hypothetical protein
MITNHADLRTVFNIEDDRCDHYHVICDRLSTDEKEVTCFPEGICINGEKISFPFAVEDLPL